MNWIAKKIIYERWQLCCLLFLLHACHSKNNYKNFTFSKDDSIKEQQNAVIAFDTIYQNKKLIRTGDLILRTGRDFTSETFRKLSTNDNAYSHCGIASIEHDSIFVYHSIGGEWNPDQKIRRDPLEVFCNPYENRGFGIFRYKISLKENNNLINYVQALYKAGVMFDMKFDLSSDERMYCSEFVYKAIRNATANRIKLSVTTLNQIKFVAIDNLFMDSNCSKIKRISFRK